MGKLGGRCEGGGEDIGDAAQGDSLGWVSRTSIGMDITDGDDQVCVAVSQSGDGDEEDHRGEQPNSVSVPFETCVPNSHRSGWQRTSAGLARTS